MINKGVTNRTIEIGADKISKYEDIDYKPEANPLLGFRAIRFCLDRKDIFKTQLRALYRASIYGNLKIMIPMISSINEIKSVREIISEVQNQLD